MKIAVAMADYGGCGFYRMWVPYKRIREMGLHDVQFILHTYDKPIEDCDVLVLQRQTDPTKLELLSGLQSRGALVLHEFDDHFHALPSANPNAKDFGSGKQTTAVMEQIVRAADACTVSTIDLAEEYRRYNSRIFVCENAVMDEYMIEAVNKMTDSWAPKRPGQFRIGFAGSDTHRGDLLTMLPALVKIMRERKDVRFVMVGADMRGMFPFELRFQLEFAGGTATNVPMLHRGTVYARQAPELLTEGDLASIKFYDLIRCAEFDLAIAPLEPTLFNRTKSALKAIEYGMMGVPALLANHAPYRRYAQMAPEEVIRLADTRDAKSWERQLRELIDDEPLRERLAKANMRHVADSHTISTKVKDWITMLDAVSGAVAA